MMSIIPTRLRRKKSLRGEQLLNALAHTARTKFGLTVWQWLPGHVGQHAPGSLHGQTFPGTNVGRAFDAYGPSESMFHFAQWVAHHTPQVTEGIYQSNYGTNHSLSIKNGVRQGDPVGFWGDAVWAEHTNHVHIGV
jgi:hypothetical protein